jgi:outer membrane immunogenic protein
MVSNVMKVGLAALGLLATPLAVKAADMPLSRPYYKAAPHASFSYYSWSGLYAGLNAGYGFGTSNWDGLGVSPKPKGGLFGLTVGYNWQAGSFVYGLEGDYAFSMGKGDAACGLGSCETKNSWLGTARGRIGYAFDRFLPYVTGGAAFGDIKASNTLTGASATTTKVGYAVGAGLEYAFLGNWTAKVEYLYADLGKSDCGIACGVVANNVSLSENIVRVGLNYKFGGPLSSRF